MNQIDISTELQIVPHLSGVRLVAPFKRSFNSAHLTIQEALAFPCNVYFLNSESAILCINEYSAFSSGFYSTNDAIGRTVLDVLKPDNATSIINIDKQIVRKNHTIISEDVMIRDDSEPMCFLTVKAPIYNNTDKIMGILGCSVMLGHQPLAKSLTLISKLGLLKLQQTLPTTVNDTVWTPREKHVIHLLTFGKTAKEIGLELNLSRRTIEHYIENMKLKMHVKSKSQLIEKILSSQNSNN